MGRTGRNEAGGGLLRGARILLDALCLLGLLSKSEGIYSLTPIVQTSVVRGKPTSRADACLTFWRDRDRLAEAVRTGDATLDIPGPQAEEMWANLTSPELLTWPQSVETARERWAQLGIPGKTRRGLHVLDVACGSGVASFALAQMDPTAHVTALDLPKVLAGAAQVAEKMGVRDQVTFCLGNLLEVEFPAQQFDVVLFGAILYYFSPENVTSVLRNAHHALVPGGLVVIRASSPTKSGAGMRSLPCWPLRCSTMPRMDESTPPRNTKPFSTSPASRTSCNTATACLARGNVRKRTKLSKKRAQPARSACGWDIGCDLHLKR